MRWFVHTEGVTGSIPVAPTNKNKDLASKSKVRLGSTVPALLFALISSPALADYPLVPDPALTPGVVGETDVARVCATGGETFSALHRKTSQALKDAVSRAYGLAKADGKVAEIDHRLPLSLGGADVAGNVWPQVWQGPCGAKAKDKLEDATWENVCRLHTMTLADAQALFLGPYWKHLPGCEAP